MYIVWHLILRDITTMDNIIETFDRFNCGMKRPDRIRHMQLCGFEFKGCWLIEPPITPKIQAQKVAESFNQTKGKPCHVVYWQGPRNMDGDRGYQYWRKEL